ncbi:MAG: hypothetical protein HKN31_08310 [Pricia sp.]|nr:hypothetical protein [Pricia sp.]
MNYLLALSLLCMVASCSKETATENEDLAAVEFRSRINQKEQEETQEVFELDLHQYYVLGQLVDLKGKKERFEGEIERGNRNLIPVLESFQKQNRMYFQRLAEIKDLTCWLLEIKIENLRKRAEEGDKEALEELLNLDEGYESCGLNINDYFSFAISTFIYAKVGGNIGGNCDPGIDWDRCIPKMKKGTLIVNYPDKQAGGQEIYFKSTSGKIISKGKMVGAHSELRGVQQMAIELTSVKQGILEFKGSNGSFEQAVNIE